MDRARLQSSVSAVMLCLVLATVSGGASLVDDMDQRPRIRVENGDIHLVAGRGKNIRFQVLEGGHVFLNNEDLVQLAESVRATADLLEGSRGGTLDTLQRSVRALTEAVNGNRGLGKRVSQLEQASGNVSTSVESPGNLDSKIRNLNSKVIRLSLQVRQLVALLKTNECTSNPCRNGGSCEDGYNGFICRCPPNWEGTLCDADVNECAHFAGTDLGCQNGATCINRPGTYECSCSAGWFGIHCTQSSNGCSSTSSRDLCGHGTCIPQPGTPAGYSCICEQGWTKEGVSPACTKDVDECASSHPACSRSPLVTCINVPGSFYCGGCPQGYTGNGFYCADIDECQLNNGGCSMNPTVQCINTQGSRMCGMCPPGYQGDGVTCSFRGVCHINNGGCHYLAQCIENQGISQTFVQCICPAGYSGSGVGVGGCVPSMGGPGGLTPSPCSSNPCVHGTCLVSGASFICSCLPGYTGPTCSLAADPCASNPCKNGGTCVPQLGSYHCRCSSEATGPNCEQLQMSCGGKLDSEEGSLRFPPSAATLKYVPNLSCAWIITTNASKVINVTFTSFHLEESSECSYDWLQIHDGRSSGDQLIKRFCGSKLPNNGTIISTHNALYLWFRSDHTVNNDGFELTWKSINPVCGGFRQFTLQGSLSSPGYPGKYPKNRDCMWLLMAPSSRRIQFHFLAMQLENHANCSFDFVEIRDGAGPRARVLEKFCNTTVPASVISSGPYTTVRFHSDGVGSDGGFLMSYSSVPGISGCGGTLSGPSGTITSPSEGDTYRHNLDCEWVIQVPAGQRIQITFETFALESSSDCWFDRLEVREGRSPSDPLVGRYCGNHVPRPYISTGNSLVIIFQSDWSVNAGGFRIQYEEFCGGVFGAPSGVITSPDYPARYPTNKKCIYEIAQPLGKSITLEFYDFEIEVHYLCAYDYLEIRDGHDANAPLVGSYCEQQPPTVVSTYNYLWLKLKTDFSRSRRGFYANYTTQDVSCGGILKAQSGVVESPRYPSMYSHNQLCRWIIVADIGKVVRLTWTSFRLESSYSCRFDYLEIYDNSSLGNSSSKIGRYCGSQTPPDITSTNNIMTLVFASDYSRSERGFQANYVQIDTSHLCGGNYFTPVGVLRSPGYPNYYPHNKDCTWIIKVPSGQQLKLNVTDFEIERHYNCAWDFLEIRNGGSVTAPLIGKYCGTNIPREIPAMSNQLYLRFQSDFSRSAKGFEIKWDGTATGCGGTLTGPHGTILSPHYPEPYGRSTECFWKIATSQGSIVQVVFVDLDLEQSPRCYFDYIAFYDGIDSSAKLLGKYCHGSSAIVIRSTSNHMFIKFKTDYSGEGRGFHINYATVCTTDIRGYQGVIESPNFPNMYPDHLDCKWTVQAPKGNKVNISFSHFNLEGPPCRYDYLQVNEAFNEESAYTPLSQKLCGSTMPGPIHSNVNRVQVAMMSDYSMGHSGFRLEWVLDGCGGRFIKPEGEFTSPGYPGNYRDSVECEWSITLPLDKSVQLTIEVLQMEGVSNCRFDSLTIYGGPDLTSPKLHDPLCHTIREPLVTTSSGNNMLVIFKSDSSYSGKGFKASYKGVNSRCGGLFIAPAGRIQSRNYPNNYDPLDDCMWLIRVAPRHTVQFTFIDVDLELHRNCSWDYVKLFDGNTTESPVMTTVCGSTLPNITTYVSSSNTMLVRMKADGSVSYKGFAANYTTACGARIVTEDFGQIELTESVNVNENNLNCSWIIMGTQPEDRVTLTVTHMDISPNYENSYESCDYSFVEVRDGEDVDAPLRGRYCGSRAPPHITSIGSALFVHIVSLYGAHFGHFTASYSVVSSACGGQLTSEHGGFASPGFPDSYPLNSECVWTINSSPGNRVLISFRSFELEVSEACNKDYLEIRENDGVGRLVGVYCSGVPSNVTVAQTLWIKFHSDGEETAAGFVADYSLLHGNDLSGPSGEVASPLYPRPYIQEADYSWRITVEFGKAITITFTDFFIEKFYDICELYLAIYDGYDETGVLIVKQCGSLLPDPVTSTSNVVYIIMHTMALRHGSLFKLNWLQVERTEAPQPFSTRSPIPGCGGRISLTDRGTEANSSSYSLQSPGFPYGYAGGLNCEWIIETPPLSHAYISFQTMDLEVYGGCYLDYVQIFEGIDGTEQWRSLNTLCHSNASSERAIEGTSLMKVLFHTDYSVNKTGFSAKVYSVCGGSIRAPNGVIEVTNTTNQFNDMRRYMVNCQWNVTVRAGRTISVEFDRFNVPAEASGSCTDSYIMLKNGHSQESPLLGNGKYCSNVIPVIPHTTGNNLYVNYAGYGGSEGFKMRFSEVSFTCGGQYLLTPSNNWVNISSPRYPNIPVPHTECTWVIMAPGGERLQVDFDDRFDFVHSYGDCDKEYVELKDGGTEVSSLIGRFCYTVPSTQTTTGNVLLVHYFTDVHDPHTGFHAKISVARCGGTIRSASGEIRSPGYPRDYPSNTECVWRIVGYRNHVLELQFQEINLPTSYHDCTDVDNLTISEVIPYNRTARLVQTVCGSTPQPNIQLASNEALIKFKTKAKSGYHMDYRGFMLNFSSTYDECGGELNTPEGQFESPGYPNGLPHYRHCEWTITVPRGRRITVNLVDVDMDVGMGSNLVFFNHDYAYFLTTFKTNTSQRQIESSSNVMKLYYYSRNSAGRRGFRATYTSNKPAVCGGDIVADTGVLEISTGFQNTSALFCQWTRSSLRPGNQTFALTILNATIGYVWNIPCQYHGTKLKVSADENSPVIAELCHNITQPYSILSPFLSTTFMASQTVRGGPLNFTARYQVSPCGGLLTGPEATVSSPGYPNSYSANLQCAWAVTFPSGQAIAVHFVGMNLESNCGHDYVVIHSGPTPSSPTIGQYCGSTAPADFVAQTNSLWIEFHSNNDVQDRGFSLQLTPVTEGCGGLFHSNTEIIMSPQFPLPYPARAECQWDIRVENGYTIQLSFIERFNIESSPGCTKDFIEVFDYRGNAYVSLGKLCGRETPAALNSSSSQMRVLFRSNEDTSGDGFKARWDVRCGGIIENVTSGQLTSPGYPKEYGNSLMCNYTVLIPGHYIRVHFDYFQLERGYQHCRFDNLTIYTPYSYSRQLRELGTYCDTTYPPEFTVKNSFTMVFRSDSSVRYGGFLMRFEVQSCGGDIRTPGSLVLPRTYVDNEYSEINCTWTVTAPENSIIVIRFSAFESYAYRQCYSDNSLSIYNGPYILEGSRLGMFCGNLTLAPPVVHSTRNTVVLEYMTYTYVRGNHFAADILFTYGESVGCGGRINATQRAQTIRSPDVDGDNMYEALLDCQWLATALEGQVLNLRITTLQIQPCVNTSSNSSNYCACDYLEIRDGPSQYSQLIGKYCGTTIPNTIVSSTNQLWIRFVSDGEQNRRGFVAQIASENSLCGIPRLNVTAVAQVFTSPNYPANYPTNLRCRWLMESDRSYDTIEIHVEEVNIAAGGRDCTEAMLQITDASVGAIISEGLGQNFMYPGNTHSANSIRYGAVSPVTSATFCGKVIPHNYYSNTGQVSVSLVTSSVASKGFKLHYSLTGCNRNYTGVQGRIKMTEIPKNCIILIQAPTNNTISLYFTENYIDYNENCDSIGIEVRDGATPSATQLGRLCGHSEYTPVFSTGPNMWIHFWNNRLNGYNNIDITYTTTDQGPGCGGTLFNYGGTFTSPFYPSNYRNASTCRWKVTVPAGTLAALRFNAFDLGSSTTCASDFVELLEVDTVTESETVRSRYCGGDNPAVFISTNNMLVLRYTVSVNNVGTGWVAYFMGKPPGMQLYDQMLQYDRNYY